MNGSKIYIRTDGNNKIATGHVMRCLAIAIKLREKGADVTFVLSDEEMVSVIQNYGFIVKNLNTEWNSLNNELEDFKRDIVVNHINKVLVDSYAITKKYMEELSSCVEVIYIDDLQKDVYSVNMLISYSIRTDNTFYEQEYKKTRLLLGGEYVPLRVEFENIVPVIRTRVEDVLITLGGTNPDNIAETILNKLLHCDKYKNIRFHVVIGKFWGENLELVKIINENSNVYIYRDVQKMSNLIQQCDVAISACGTTLYELCVCGVPGICIEISENQQGSDVWEKRGLMYYAGNVSQDPVKCIQRVISGLDKYIHSYTIRKERAFKMHQFVDGKGAIRIAEKIMEEKSDRIYE